MRTPPEGFIHGGMMPDEDRDQVLANLFAERWAQFRGWGISSAVLTEARATIRDLWRDGPGGWVHEWSRLADAAAEQGRILEAAMCHGAARFPAPVSEARRRAAAAQRECYLRASADFPCAFSRRVMTVEVPGGERAEVAVHLFSRSPGFSRSHGQPAPLLCLSGGLDTYKVELHRTAVLLAKVGFTVAAVDMPGTGENGFPLRPDSERVYARLIATLAEEMAASKRGIFGVSFGGHWAAKLALRGDVDAALDLGGPVGVDPASFAGLVRRLPPDMRVALAHLERLDEEAFERQGAATLEALSLTRQGLLSGRTGAPLLVVNGDQDPYVPLADTLVFRDMPGAEVWLVPHAGHCAGERIKWVFVLGAAWLHAQLMPHHFVDRSLVALGRFLWRR